MENMHFLNYKYLLTGILLIPAAYLWKQVYITYITMRRHYKEEQLFHDRHNCVIMYSRGCIRGWPPKYNIKLNTSNLDQWLEPYLYFINTAKFNLDMAMMRIAINPLFDALHKAVARGVKVRLIVNFLSIKSAREEYQKLLESGVEVAFYVDKSEQLNYIMHCKYMVKDYNENSGYICMGSMNFTGLITILNNYEDITLTSNNIVVEAFHNNFAASWHMINRDNQNEFNKSLLSECGFIR